MLKRKRIRIKGIVQGVGFRPFVYRLANDFKLKGFVRNTTAGVEIDIEGQPRNIDRFIRNLKTKKPPAARIDEVKTENSPINRYKKFIIEESKASEGFTQISPDIATCTSCLNEMNDPGDRRYKFPFINCTNCGPRYSIIIQTPYDRIRTSMHKFKMCSACTKEFKKITDRRFHAQPDCCVICGPEYSLYSINGEKIKTNDPILKTTELLKNDNIVAIKGIGGFHIACDATNCDVIIKLRQLKNRPTKPFAIMTKNNDLEKIVYISRDEKKIINSPIAPIMLLRKKGKIICEAIAPNNPYLGIIIPYAPIHHLLLNEIPYLVMTSANIQDEPIIKEEKEVVEKLRNIVSFYLGHNRSIENRCDDSIGFHLSGRGFSIIRRSRGYAPIPLELPVAVKPTLGVGPYLKNTFTLANGHEAYISPHIGDLDNLKTLEFFNEMIEKYKRWFRIEPQLIVHDLHPDYLSTKVSQKIPGKKIGVQHHIAHVVSCLGEHKLYENAIGVAFDGTGYGLDGNIWGGEFFVGNLYSQKRVAHLQYLPLPGGESSIKRPYRIALAYIYKLIGKTLNIASASETEIVKRMIDEKQNLVYTSSIGRLFDCVSAMLGVTREITYEAEAAINLEYTAAKDVRTSYPYKIKDATNMVIELENTIAAILQDMQRKISRKIIAAKFHNTVAQFSLDIAKRLRKMYQVDKICLSGGVFQNHYLLQLMVDKYEHNGFKVYVHQKLPTNDGCISYGQVIFGNNSI